MRARSSRPLSHATPLRALALFAWLVLVCVPVVVHARAPAAMQLAHATAGQVAGTVTSSDCCHGQGAGHSMGQCEACAASLSGVVLPVMPAMLPVRFAALRWPALAIPPVAGTFIPPLRPPRA